MIIGANIERNNKIYSYQTSLINGPFDADKLDYIKRDSLTAGLSLQYDMKRLFTKIQIHTVPSSNSRIEHRLVINFNGITAIEISKMYQQCQDIMLVFKCHHVILVQFCIYPDFFSREHLQNICF